MQAAPSPHADFAAHIARVRGLPSHEVSALRTLFSPGSRILVARAPGRLDVMGGIGDYSGSLVLEMPIAEAAFVAVQRTGAPGLAVASLQHREPTAARVATISAPTWSQLLESDYQTISKRLHGDSQTAWTAYVIGVILCLLRETGATFPGGLRILVDSQVPEGKGVSSSAAIEVATMRAMTALLELDLPGQELARLCQLAENRIVGAPCGIMDQMTSAVGRSNELLALHCQPANIEGYVPVPSEIAFWGVDSGIRHAVTGADYASVRCGAFMGYRIVADAAGLPVSAAAAGDESIEIVDPRWHGYLANIAPNEFHCHFAKLLPNKMLGHDFLTRYIGTTDKVTRVAPARTYAIHAPTLHPIEENARVHQFRSYIEGPLTDLSLDQLGQLMYAAHASYSACGLGSDGTDLLVELVRETGPTSGLFGAKITGGGSGGTVAILGRADAGSAVDRIAQQYSEQTGRQTHVFRGSSPGAYHTPIIEVII